MQSVLFAPRGSSIITLKAWDWNYIRFIESVTNIILGQRRRPASTDRTACRQFQTVFPVITGSFPTNVIAHLHGLSMDLTVGRTVRPIVDSTVGWTVGLTVKLCKHWFDSRSNYWSNCGNHWPTSEPNAGYSDASGWLPRCEAKCVQRTHFQWGSVPLRVDIKGTELPPANILIPLKRQLTALQLCRWVFI